jgi:hypothetical protein
MDVRKSGLGSKNMKRQRHRCVVKGGGRERGSREQDGCVCVLGTTGVMNSNWRKRGGGKTDVATNLFFLSNN